MPADRDLTEGSYRWIVGLAVFAFVAVSSVWAILAPGFRAPDETKHFNSVLRLEYGGGWPEPGSARMSEGVQDAIVESGLRTRHPGDPDLLVGFPVASVGETAPTAPTRLDETNSLPGPEQQTLDSMTQHPPLYYYSAAMFSKAVGADGRSWEIQLLWVRLFTVLCTAPIPLIAALGARLVTGRRWAGAVAAVLPLAVPQLGHIAGSVSNDPLVSTLEAGAILGATMMIVRGLRWRVTVMTGVLAGLAMLTKGFALGLIPIILVAVFWAHERPAFCKRVAHAGAVMATALATGGFWWVINIVRYGELQPLAKGGIYPESPDPDRHFLKYLWEAVPRLIDSFWGKYAWLQIRLDTVIVIALTGLVCLGVVLAYVWARRQWKATTILLSFIVVAAFSIFVKMYGIYSSSGVTPGLQGRYLFGGVAGLAGVGAIVVASAKCREKWRLGAAVATVGGVLSVALYGLSVGFRGFYMSGDKSLSEGYSSWTDWSLPGSSGPVIAWVLLVLAGVSLGVVGWRIGSLARSS